MRALIATTLAAGTIACASAGGRYNWRDYDRNQRFVPVSVEGERCASIGVQNLDSAQQRAVVAVAEEVCGIERMPPFADSVKGRRWLASCERPNGQPDVIDGDEVLRILRQDSLVFSVHPRKPFRAYGLTDRYELSGTRVAIAPAFIAQASDADTANAVSLRETLAHEMTHVASDRFKDRGVGSECDADSLVSYGVERIVGRLWIAQQVAK